MASRRRSPPDHRQDVMSFWGAYSRDQPDVGPLKEWNGRRAGYKFETLATLPETWDECSREAIEARPRDVVSNKAQFCSIVKTGLGDARLILGGEVDAGSSPAPSQQKERRKLKVYQQYGIKKHPQTAQPIMSN